MTRFNHASEIIELAQQLGIPEQSPVQGILDHCQRRVAGWVAEAGGLANIESVESLVTQRLRMVFEEIRSDEDWDRLIDVYVRGKKEIVFAAMRSKFNDDNNPTYGALVFRRNAGIHDSDRYVAVIDCRGDKLARRFFTRWHEIAHRLTTHADGGDTETGYRSEHDPIEQLMDHIAGHIGFFEHIFDPAFRNALQGESRFSFKTVQSIIDSAFPDASFQSTLVTCTRRVTHPVIYLEAALAHKKDVKRKLATPSLYGEPTPPGQLRAVTVIPNSPAKEERFTIPTNMRVPLESVISRIFEAELLTDGQAIEDLNLWESQGKTLSSCKVVVEARKVPDKVMAVIQPV